MTQQPPTQVAEAAPALRPQGRLWLLALMIVTAGAVLRWSLGVSADPVGEWEADGFVIARTGWHWGEWSRVHPPGHGMAYGRGAPWVGVEDVGGIRALAIGFSVLAWVCAAWMAWQLSRLSRAPRRSMGFAALWMAVIWAVFPTLVGSGRSPTPESLSGAALCLLAGSLAWRMRTGSFVSWCALIVFAALAMLMGGVLVALGVGVGLIVYLVPIPRLPVAVSGVAALAIAASLAWFVQRGPDAERPWRPDTAPAFALAALIDAPVPDEDQLVADEDLRAARIHDQALSGAGRTHGLSLAMAFSRRLLLDQLSPRRFVDGPVHPLAIGLLDVVLRGGLLLFAAAALALIPRSSGSAFPRGGVAAGLLALVALRVVGAVGPYGLAPIDLVLLGAAGAGVAGAEPGHGRVRRLAFAVGGVMLGALGLGAWFSELPTSAWSQRLSHGESQGRELVSLLDEGGPHDAVGHLLAAQLLMDGRAPFLRRPEAALDQAMAALQAGAPEARPMVIRAQVENLEFVEADRLARDLIGPDGELTPEGRVLRNWVADQERRWRGSREP